MKNITLVVHEILLIQLEPGLYYLNGTQVLCLTSLLLHMFNGPLSGTTQVGRYQKGKTNLDFTEARVSEWQ